MQRLVCVFLDFIGIQDMRLIVVRLCERFSVSHTKTTLVGTSICVPITDGRLNLGTWQGGLGSRYLG